MSNTPLILVINCGSSSLKFSVLAADSSSPLLSGLAECLGLADARITIKEADGTKKAVELAPGAAHTEALESLLAGLKERGMFDRVAAIGHRVVHGGNRFHASVLITPEVIADVEAVSGLAPLHNPANLLGIRAAIAAMPTIPQIAVFDTAFHQTLSPAAYVYGLPYEYLEKYDVRRYGFHGTSHRYVAGEAVRLLKLDPKDHGLVIAHLGNGSSVSAVRNGISVDTSMGLTPLEGLVMGTRCGDIDFGAMIYLARVTGKTIAELDKMANKESGFLGISGISSDCRTLEAERAKGNSRATLAIDVFVHRLARHIGAHAASLKRLDAVVFTGGIGENSALIRRLTLEHLEVFGFRLDSSINDSTFGGKAAVITREGTRPLAVVVPTDEEGLIARDAATLAGLA